MFPFSRKKRLQPETQAVRQPVRQPDYQLDQQPNVLVVDVVSVPRIDRWRVYHRLQELKIPCWCLPDGSLRVEIETSLGALLLRSVVQQFIASRSEMVNWLERCWEK